MAQGEPIWLVHNEASGSNDEAALNDLVDALEANGRKVVRKISFPQEQAPDAASLERAGIETLCVFAGDGTVHSVVTGLFGWNGRILVLPGGTMNMLSKRLHGDAEASDIVARPGRAVRPPVLKTRHGYGLTGALAGPGAAWNDVREAMREAALGDFANSAVNAMIESISGDRVLCKGLEETRPAGYVAISITPGEMGVDLRGYYAETPGDCAGQLVALLQRNFRNGPHDALGTLPSAQIASSVGKPMGLLIDGEPEDGHSCEEFSLTRCGVDLLATDHAS